jgi:hypothetical protein
MNDDQADALVDRGQRMAHGILSLYPARHDLRHLAKRVSVDDFSSAVMQIRFRDGKDDGIDDGRGLKDTEGMNKKRQPAERAKLLPDGASHPEA